MKSIPNSEYKPAIYARLSDEDNRAGVSLSIENQLDVMREYCKVNGFITPKAYFDDDKTGTDFNRKGFQDMYADAKAGKIDLIIIKDTSRFGRNWVQSGYYFEKIEDLGIRIIFIQESIDTIDPKCPGLQMLPFYFVFNEWHSRTTSEKIKTVFHQMALDGKHRAPYAPYGYQKDPNDKHKLIIDPYSSQIVKRIYEMRLKKMSYGSIVFVLNSEGILSPSAYSSQTYGGTTNVISKHGKWTKDSLNHLFRNVAYKGDTANEVKTVVSYKNHKAVRQPMSNWVIATDTHEAIITREDWQKCYDMIQQLGRIRRTEASEILPFTGLLICADCGYKMRHNHSYSTLKSGERKRTDWYHCPTYATTGRSECSSHYITIKDLMLIVCNDIRLKAQNVIHDEKAARAYYLKHKAGSDSSKSKSDEKELKQAEKRLSDIDRLIQAAFEKSVLSKTDIFTGYMQKYESEKIELTDKVRNLKACIQDRDKSVNEIEVFIDLMKKNAESVTLDRATAVALIDKIIVSAQDKVPREIVIHYNFIGEI
jgi:DNA invertase Pin-like site-specific DNA recombinase